MIKKYKVKIYIFLKRKEINSIQKKLKLLIYTKNKNLFKDFKSYRLKSFKRNKKNVFLENYIKELQEELNFATRVLNRFEKIGL